MSTTERLLFDRTVIPLAGKGLDAYALRQKAIANNVANAETDGYERRTVSFEDQLKEALGTDSDGLIRTHPDHLPKPGELAEVDAELEIDSAQDYWNGHNNVDIDREMTELSRALLTFNYTTRLVRGSFDTLQLAIRGTR
ncbi:MAG: flagellar basal body rod protein FlgB [Calditrichaeota bacterium]|nr:flagellar basal body rod protein FlgB [Candidatus Cloacimonadota bacterium]MCA9786400.1 flagellar basal body rod protein FlgB [Candidatus Cloacimonadota bacterium]MCB1045894.1 flagellar basal body rod protein FlgB [Calditrichota bacterium]MCB9474736.1 flagellar basal body rod protein FlgB [Candidatus Delongbacteria bacterium]